MPDQTLLTIMDFLILAVSVAAGYMMYRKMKKKYARPLEKFKDPRPYLVGITVGFICIAVLYLIVAAVIVWVAGS